jgi:hypothetical protein
MLEVEVLCLSKSGPTVLVMQTAQNRGGTALQPGQRAIGANALADQLGISQMPLSVDLLFLPNTTSRSWRGLPIGNSTPTPTNRLYLALHRLYELLGRP